MKKYLQNAPYWRTADRVTSLKWRRREEEKKKERERKERKKKGKRGRKKERKEEKKRETKETQCNASRCCPCSNYIRSFI